MAINNGRPLWSSDGRTLTNVLLKDTNLYGTYNVTDTWYNGELMDDEKLDSDLVYVKYQNKYLVQNFEYGQILQKDTMEDMRNLSSKEILLLKMGVYKHIQLNGYYTKGDTPSPIEYKLSSTPANDDGGGIIEVDDIKLEHQFNTDINVEYFGVSTSQEDNTESFMRALEYRNSYSQVNVKIGVGVFKFNNPVTYSFSKPFTIEGAGNSKTEILYNGAQDIDRLFDFNSTSDVYYYSIKGLFIRGVNKVNYPLYINRINYFILDDIRITGGKVSAFYLNNSWCYSITNCNFSYSNNGMQLGENGSTNNQNGYVGYTRMFGNKIGLYAICARNTVFDNINIEQNSTTGIMLNNNVGLDFRSMYLEFNGEEGINIEYASDDIVLSKHQIIINGGIWRGGNLKPDKQFLSQNIRFNNMMVVQRGGVFETLCVLNCRYLRLVDNWSNQSNVNLLYFKEKNTTELNNLYTENNRFLNIQTIDYSRRNLQGNTDYSTWNIKERLLGKISNTDLSLWSKTGAVTTFVKNGKYAGGFDIYDGTVATNATLNVYTQIPNSVTNFSKVGFKVYYKSAQAFNIVITKSVSEGNVIASFPASSEWKEASVIVPSSGVRAFVELSIGIYAATGTFSVTKPTLFYVGNYEDTTYINQGVAVPNGSSIDTLLTSLRNAGIIAT